MYLIRLLFFQILPSQSFQARGEPEQPIDYRVDQSSEQKFFYEIYLFNFKRKNFRIFVLYRSSLLAWISIYLRIHSSLDFV